MTGLVRPRRLRPGDTVALVAPAGPVRGELLDAALPVLKSWELNVLVGDCVRSRHPALGYLTASDDARADEFTRAWLDPAVSMVLAARGGYGTMRILDHLDWPMLRAAGPKLFAGSSDLTAMHQAINVHLGFATLFSPMPAGVLFDERAAQRLRTTLFEPEQARLLCGPGIESLTPGRATGLLTGGNLSLLAATVGAAEHRPARDAIVVLEDVGEDVYRLDRMLTQLLRAGWFEQATGIVLGSWAGCGSLDEVRTLMLDRLGPLDVPIGWEAGFGHIPSAPTIPLGVPAELDAHAGTLRLVDPALA